MFSNTLHRASHASKIKLLQELLSEVKTLQQKMSASINAPTPAVEAAQPAEVKQLQETIFTKKQKPILRRDKIQQATKKKTTAYVPGKVNLQVVGNGANGTPCSVYLFTDQSRYLFNCGEGTQRLAHEHKTKLSRLEQIFLTRNTWSMIGGFPGLALTIQDAGVRELAVHGPPHLGKILQSMRRFVVLHNLNVTTMDCTEVQDFEDAVMSVKFVPLYGTDKSKNPVIAYICKLKPRAGALILEKCVEKGVPPGPLLGLLKNGIDVTLENGVVVKSADVSEPSETALKFIFLDIPSAAYLPGLEANAADFFKIESEAACDEVAVVLHFTAANLLTDNIYQTFVERFSKETQHIYLNAAQNSFSGYISAHRIQHQLNLLNPRVFPILGEGKQLCSAGKQMSENLKKTKLNEEDVIETTKQRDEKEKQDVSNTDIAVLTNFHLRPRKGFDDSIAAKLNPSEYIQEAQALEGFPTILKRLQSEQRLNTPLTSKFPIITFLGTGSCIPNKTRNVSSIMLQPKESSYVLLDCGEGTLGQIVRFYGSSKAEEVIRNLHIIYVSHLHADHHIGLIGLLNERRRLGIKEKLLLLAPKQIEFWLAFYQENIEDISNTYELIGNAQLLEQPLQPNLASKRDVGVAAIRTCLVRHCAHSFGICLTLDAHDEQPIKITYSGDTMPCKDLVDLGMNSTVLIHEATMEDDLLEEAKIKTHSTISQAIQQGQEMQAKYILLTHFSQRYAKLPRMQETQELKNVSIAFDNMQVTLEDLENFHILYPALKTLFAEHAEEMEQRAAKRELKLERKRKLLNIN